MDWKAIMRELDGKCMVREARRSLVTAGTKPRGSLIGDQPESGLGRGPGHGLADGEIAAALLLMSCPARFLSDPKMTVSAASTAFGAFSQVSQLSRRFLIYFMIPHRIPCQEFSRLVYFFFYNFDNIRQSTHIILHRKKYLLANVRRSF